MFFLKESAVAVAEEQIPGGAFVFGVGMAEVYPRLTFLVSATPR
jgi:hypothetical protein